MLRSLTAKRCRYQARPRGTCLASARRSRANSRLKPNRGYSWMTLWRTASGISLLRRPNTSTAAPADSRRPARPALPDGGTRPRVALTLSSLADCKPERLAWRSLRRSSGRGDAARDDYGSEARRAASVGSRACRLSRIATASLFDLYSLGTRVVPRRRVDSVERRAGLVVVQLGTRPWLRLEQAASRVVVLRAGERASRGAAGQVIGSAPRAGNRCFAFGRCCVRRRWRPQRAGSRLGAAACRRAGR
jgi:hypothetical protein